MPQSGRPARRAVSRPVCADETNPAWSVDRTVRGTSTIGSHPARSALAVAPHDPPRSVGACRSAIGRPTRPPTSVWASSPRGLLQDSGVLNARITLLPRPVVKDYACPFPFFSFPLLDVLLSEKCPCRFLWDWTWVILLLHAVGHGVCFWENGHQFRLHARHRFPILICNSLSVCSCRRKRQSPLGVVQTPLPATLAGQLRGLRNFCRS
jgi:hypothetical protein